MNKSIIASLAVAGVLVTGLLYSTSDVEAKNELKKAEVAYSDNKPPVQDIKNPEKPMQKWYEGTLNYYDIEGGFFGFTSKNGENLLPMGLAKKYQKAGAKLKLYGYVDNDVATIQMWGKPFKVLKVEVIEEGGATHPSQL
ncbi:hypothetical protein [Thalassotalea sp. PS06]|uniref:hypothetical protein n=1 Tax=Thalassotalea sp. PS06 TaxID=2594005 RepID=UPI001164CDA7|nr:hypothetical protein [Thalassotalea sp. PS06]QDP02506.1 hypothetical protein FNC98_14795 [Thalassotalea sp. PS06]